MRDLLSKRFDPDDRSPEAKGQRFLKRLLEFGQRTAASDAEIAEYNRQLIEAALNAAAPGEEVNVDHLPLRRRADGKAPIAGLFTAPETLAKLREQPCSPIRNSDI